MGLKDWTDQNVDKPSWVRRSEKQEERRKAKEAQRQADARKREKRGVMP